MQNVRTQSTPSTEPREPVASRARTEVAPASDPLGEVLHLLRLEGSLYCRAELTAPWGVEIPELTGSMTFLVITEGECWVETEGAEPRRFRAGDLVLVPHGEPYVMRSDPDSRSEALDDIAVEQVSERFETMHYGGGGARSVITCGVVRLDHVAGQRLIELLPPLIHVDAWDDEAGGWLQSTVRFITREARALRPGGETMMTRLSDALIIQALRLWLDTAPEADHGWLAALRDDQLGRALAAIHRDPAHAWSVEEMARNVGMSRSSFSQRFADVVGEPPARYLTRWRMQLARMQLMETTDPVGVVADQVGYRSEAAFCRAFKQMFGVSPGSVRR